MITKIRNNWILKTLFNRIFNRGVVFYLKTCYFSKIDKKLFKGVKTYCMFIGTGRSGHTLIASLIDAHPNAVISNEVNTLQYVINRYEKSRIFSMILRNSRRHAKQKKIWTGYSYFVENQMQGAFTRIDVIGDKKGGISTDILKENVVILDEIIEKWNVEFKFIHVIRNPFDVISSMVRRDKRGRERKYESRLEEKIKLFFQRMETVKDLYTLFGKSILEIHHEEFIRNPKKISKKLYVSLG